MTREKDLKELYFLAELSNGRIMFLPSAFDQKRVVSLLKQYTPYGALGHKAKTPFFFALAAGAKVDEHGLLIIEDQQVRQKVANNPLTRFLPKELISRITPRVDLLFRHFKKIPSSTSRVSNIPRARKTPRSRRRR